MTKTPSCSPIWHAPSLPGTVSPAIGHDLTEETNIPNGVYWLEFKTDCFRPKPASPSAACCSDSSWQREQKSPAVSPSHELGSCSTRSVSTHQENVPRPTPDQRGLSFPHCPGLFIFPPPGSHTISSSLCSSSPAQVCHSWFRESLLSPLLLSTQQPDTSLTLWWDPTSTIKFLYFTLYIYSITV